MIRTFLILSKARGINGYYEISCLQAYKKLFTGIDCIDRQMMWTLSSSVSPDEAHEVDSQVIASRGISKDAIEGVMSFLEKRDPNFPNKISTDMPSIYPWQKSKFDKS